MPEHLRVTLSPINVHVSLWLVRMVIGQGGSGLRERLLREGPRVSEIELRASPGESSVAA